MKSKSLIVLEAKNAAELYEYWDKAKTLNIPTHIFREPDIGDEITAILFEPSKETVKLLANLPCAGKSEGDQKAKRRNELNKRERINKMVNTDQTEGQNILQHGRSVREHYFALVEHLKGEIDLSQYENWKLPEWLDTYREEILSSLASTYVMDRYLTLHDCGKPDVLTYDEEGRKRFPGHAESSAKVYSKKFGDGSEESKQIEDLILHDMDIHLLKAVGVEEFVENPNAISHLIAGLAELTSNASMFGGVESTGFKMKYHQLNQRGKAIMKELFEGKKK